MKFFPAVAAASLAFITSCNMENPLLTESSNPYGAPAFDKIRNEHYVPAFKAGIEEAKAEIDSITANPEEPDFRNTIEALEYSGRTLNRVSGIFYNLMEADTDDEMQAIAEEIAPMMTEYSMYISLNKPLFEKVKAVYMKKDSLDLDQDQKKLRQGDLQQVCRGTFPGYPPVQQERSGFHQCLYSSYNGQHGSGRSSTVCGGYGCHVCKGKRS